MNLFLTLILFFYFFLDLNLNKYKYKYKYQSEEITPKQQSEVFEEEANRGCMLDLDERVWCLGWGIGIFRGGLEGDR